MNNQTTNSPNMRQARLSSVQGQGLPFWDVGSQDGGHQARHGWLYSGPKKGGPDPVQWIAYDEPLETQCNLPTHRIHP